MSAEAENKDARPGDTGATLDCQHLAQELRESNALLKEAESIAHLGSWKLDMKDNQLSWSDEVYRIFGVAPQSFAATYDAFLGFVHPDDRQAVAAAYGVSVQEQRDSYEIEHRVVRPDGEIRHVQEKCRHVRDAGGEIVESLGMVQDITDLVHTRAAQAREQERFHLIVEAAPMAMLMANAQGRIVLANPALEKLFGYASGELLGQPVEILLPDDLRGRHVGPREHFVATPAVRQMGKGKNLKGRHKDGSEVLVEVGLSYMTSSEGNLKVIATIVDITERRRAEQILENYSRDLEHQVEQRTSELSRAKEAAEAANIAKSAFLANMSHEIRTPLNAILGMAAMIRRESLSAKQTERLDKLDQASRHLTAVTNDILDLAAIESGKFSLAEGGIDLEGLIGQIAEQIGPQVLAKQIEFVVDIVPPAVPLCGDGARLRQALQNYADNAVKFTDKGKISLRVKSQEETALDIVLRFEVEDTGSGIAPDILPRLFHPFEQADNSLTRKFGGTGLGLVITKKIAELMDGAAGVDSRAGVGSTFWFTARLRKAADVVDSEDGGTLTADEAVLRRDHAGRHILLVDDDPLAREIALFLLDEAGLSIDTAENGDDAVKLARSRRYDLILLDLQMPQMNGLETARLIRDLPGGAAVPIIALSGSISKEDQGQCVAAGMDAFVAKPLLPEEFYATLLGCLRTPRH